MVSVPLIETVTVTLDGAGNGQAQLGVSSARETWHPSNIAVQCSTRLLESVCSIYVGPQVQARYLRDRTITGSTGDLTSAIVDDIGTGIYIFAVWEGADPGTRATVTVNGTKDI